MGLTLKEFFETNNKVAIAFSGGVDSTFLLHEAIKYGADVTAYYVKSVFQPQHEFDAAVKLSEEMRGRMKIIEVDVLESKEVTANPPNRCYYCKQAIFGNILKAASADGYSMILDGTNASDAEDDRPGMKALKEMQVRSPLRECGLTKVEIRRLSKEAGLETWDRPAYACLATRVAAGEEITGAKLERIEKAEAYMMELGFVDFRVRASGEVGSGVARLEIRESQIELLIKERENIMKVLGERFGKVLLDLEFRPEMEL